MKETIKLIVGLGNPGMQYENTRHNAGAGVVTALAKLYNANLREDKKHFGLTTSIVVKGHEVKLLIPTTYMNLSGKSVATIANFYKILPSEILVIHDELDLPPGVAKFKFSGGHGGHNGLRDIISKLGNCRDFYRLRVGIGHPGDKNLVASYVLNKAPQTEFAHTEKAAEEAVCCLELLFSDGLAKAQNRLHSFKVVNKG